MIKRPVVRYGVFLFLLFVCSPVLLHAERIEHHGVTVEAEADARDCISCHDGSLGHNVSFCTVQCGFKTSHSILKEYPPRGKERLFAPVAAVKAKGIKFIDGKVTCISCHNLKNPNEHHLVMDNSGSRLCLACHIKM